VHLVPSDRLDRRIIDDERVCAAIDSLNHYDVGRWADAFAILGDPTRLALLLAIRGAGPISVSDLATATGLNGDTASQALRFLRANGLVATHRDGRVVRYELTDPTIGDLLARLTPLDESHPSG
jgi:DNA-binding transcriptional ArsR family regulator